MTADQVANILHTIATASMRPMSLQEVCRRTGVDPNSANEMSVLIQFLELFDSVEVSNDPGTGETCLKSRSEIASYFLASLAAHIREGKRVVSNWERPGVSEGPLEPHEILSGPQFLYLIERNRVESLDLEKAAPTRHTFVVKAVIKAARRKTGEATYLVQFDNRARQYQLIGGHRRLDDTDMLTALKREISEELPRAQLRYPEQYLLKHLHTVTTRELSLTYGAFTEYQIHYYQPHFKLSSLAIAPTDRWISERELLRGETEDGLKINESAISDLNQVLPGGLQGLKPSLVLASEPWIIQLWNRRRWEMIGLVITILGLVLTIFQIVHPGNIENVQKAPIKADKK